MPALTPELCALVPPAPGDPGPAAHLCYQTEEERQHEIDATVAALGGEEAVWLFAYGSLLWKPAGPLAEEIAGTVHGFHRAFCLASLRWRGCPERPGLVLGLAAGGSCRGRAQRLEPSSARDTLSGLWRREITVVPPNQRARIVEVATDERGVLPAIAFVAEPAGPSWRGDLSRDEVVAMLSTGAGVWGSSADYLRSVVVELERHGVRDDDLWSLQEDVARRIREDHASRA